MPQYALSVICPPDAELSVLDSDAKIIATKLPSNTTIKRLGPNSVEFVITTDGVQAAAEYKVKIAAQFAGARADVNCLPIENRRKRLLIADMDSTMIQQECIDEIADFAGVGAHVADITERAMRGELDFDAALNERVGLLKGLPEAKLIEVFEQRIKLMPGARTLIQTMKKNGAFCALVSGGFTFFTSRVAEAIGFSANQANTLEIANGKLTGRVVSPILGKQAKHDALNSFASKKNIPLGETLAVGDGANDLAMIKAAGLGVAYRAKPIVAAEADAQILHNDLTALLYLQGYTHEEVCVDSVTG